MLPGLYLLGILDGPPDKINNLQILFLLFRHPDAGASTAVLSPDNRDGKETMVSWIRNMKRTRSLFFLFLLLSIAALGGGCATLPDVSAIMDGVPAAREPDQIASAKGPLSSDKARPS